MGKLVEALAPEYEASIAGVVTARDAERALRERDFGPVDVAIDFTLRRRRAAAICRCWPPAASTS